jgi:hypothetical protein
LYDRNNLTDLVTAGTLTFSDGSTVAVPALDNSGLDVAVTFPAKSTTSVRFSVANVSAGTLNPGSPNSKSSPPNSSCLGVPFVRLRLC